MAIGKKNLLLINMDNKHFLDNIDVFACPQCRGGVELRENLVACKSCQAQYGIEDGVPLMFAPNDWDGKKDVTKEIKAFYEQTPFPNYESLETASDLIRKAEQSHFAKALNEQIPFGTRILEAGCGTGQLTNYLGIANRTLFGADMCLNSLKLANDFRRRNSLERIGFYQMNLFRPIFREESFDLVICNGVLHHTSDPYGGFASLSKLVRKNGYILIGLYNKYGRLITDLRRVIFKIFGDKHAYLDPHFRNKQVGDVRKKTWFRDQYQNPHESKHTTNEVFNWFEQNGFQFTYGIPSPRLFEEFNPKDDFFKPRKRNPAWEQLLAQLTTIPPGSREGGLYLMIGKKIDK